jgi:glycerol kinase
MPQSYILALDQGTTSSRAILFDHKGQIIGIAQKEFTQYYPHSGWVEHDAQEIWSSQAAVVAELLAQQNLKPSQIAAIGITNQRETVVAWDKNTGEPLSRAIVWQDRRTASVCDQLNAEGYASVIQQKTGLVLDAYFSATKMQWLLNHSVEVQQAANEGRLAFGTVDSWLVWKLTNGELYITDASNASRTMLYNLHTGDWDAELLAKFGIPMGTLPEIKPSSFYYGTTKNSLFSVPVPIAGIAGDQQAALFGQLAWSKGMVKNTYGTGCFMMLNTGDQIVESQHKLISTVAWQIGEKRTYALEGSIFVAGAVVQWLRDGLGVIQSSSEVEALAASVEDNGGVYFVPALTGLGAPHWDPYARGTLLGLSRGTNSGHIARAALESIAYQTADVLLAMQLDTANPITELRVDGGATANNLLMQWQAEVLQMSVIRPKILETTAMGAAFLAGLAVNFWQSTDSLQNIWEIDKEFKPTLSKDQVNPHYRKWMQAVEKAKNWEIV